MHPASPGLPSPEWPAPDLRFLSFPDPYMFSSCVTSWLIHAVCLYPFFLRSGEPSGRACRAVWHLWSSGPGSYASNSYSPDSLLQISGRRFKTVLSGSLPAAPGQPGLYRIFLQIQYLRDLADFKALHIIQDQDETVFFIQRIQKLIKFIIFQWHAISSLLRQLFCGAFPSAGIQDIDTFVDQDPDQPGLEELFVLQAVQLFIAGQDCLLDGICDIIIRSQITSRNLIHRKLLAFHQFHESIAVMSFCSFY